MSRLMRRKCQGCKTALNRKKSIPLPGGWSVNHYGGSEGFFGWLALQPVAHRMTLANLTPEESRELGPLLKNLERGIRGYWRTKNQKLVKRVYVMCFLEGQLERSDELWHLHFHLVPRFQVLKPLMGKPHKPEEIDSYKIAKLSHILPSFLNRRIVETSKRAKKDQRILHGVVKAAGLSLVKKSRPRSS